MSGAFSLLQRQSRLAILSGQSEGTQGVPRRFAGRVLRSERNSLIGSSLDIWERALVDAESRAGGHDAHRERLCRLPERRRGVAAKGRPKYTV
jgi:hypothetical protein